MITTLGKNHIRSYLAGIEPSIGQSLAVGIRNNAPSANDTEMGFEVARVPVTSVSLDPATDKIIFKGTLDDGAAQFNVYEVGLWSSTSDSSDSQLVLSFDEYTEVWEGTHSGFVEAPTTSRVGTTLMNFPVAGTTATQSTYLVDGVDFTELLGPNDSWSIAFNKIGASSVNVKLLIASAEGSIELSFFPANTTATGFIFGSTLVSEAESVGNFDPSAVTEFTVKVIPAAGNSVAGTVQLDGLVATNTPFERGGSTLVARSVLAVPFVSNSAGAADVEYEMSVNL